MADMLVGMLSIMAGAALNNLGIVLQKRQINIIEEGVQDGDPSTLSAYVRNPIWLLGIIMQTILVWPFLVYGLSIIGVTLAQPLSNSGIIVLIIGLVWFLNERLSRSEGIGAILLIIGVVAIGVGGVVGDINQYSFFTAASLGNLSWLLSFIGLLLVSLLVLMRVSDNSKAAVLGLLAGICYAIVSISMQVFTISLDDLTTSLALIVFFFGLMGTIIGTVFGILTIQEAFKRGRAVSVVPFMQITMNLIPIIAGIWVFNQQITEPVFFWMGTIGIIVVASLLARFQE